MPRHAPHEKPNRPTLAAARPLSRELPGGCLIQRTEHPVTDGGEAVCAVCASRQVRLHPNPPQITNLGIDDVIHDVVEIAPAAARAFA